MIDTRWVLTAGITFMVFVIVSVKTLPEYERYYFYKHLGKISLLGTILGVFCFYQGILLLDGATFLASLCFLLGAFFTFDRWAELKLPSWFE